MKRLTLLAILIVFAFSALALSAPTAELPGSPGIALAKKPARWCASWSPAIGYFSCHRTLDQCQAARKRMIRGGYTPLTKRCVKTAKY
jgi:hypothetical protein